MALIKDFTQSKYIQQTGNIMPAGICRGLVVQWLISISKGVTGDEDQFWKDADDIYNGEQAALLGKGYAKAAWKFQREYEEKWPEDITTGYLLEHNLESNGILDRPYYGAFEDTRTIANYALNADNRYFILSIQDDNSGHSIGMYRTMTPFGKSSKVSIFDPNIGKFYADGLDGIKADLDIIGRRYGGHLNMRYKILEYK